MNLWAKNFMSYSRKKTRNIINNKAFENKTIRTTKQTKCIGVFLAKIALETQTPERKDCESTRLDVSQIFQVFFFTITFPCSVSQA